MREKAENVDAYIAGYPPDVQKLLEQMRSTIKKAAPKAVEAISYAIPGYKLQGVLVYFAGYANHIGFYPGAGALTEFAEEISTYKTSKGTVQFPLDEKLPLKLVADIVKFRVKQNLEKKK